MVVVVVFLFSELLGFLFSSSSLSVWDRSLLFKVKLWFSLTPLTLEYESERKTCQIINLTIALQDNVILGIFLTPFQCHLFLCYPAGWLRLWCNSKPLSWKLLFSCVCISNTSRSPFRKDTSQKPMTLFPSYCLYWGHRWSNCSLCAEIASFATDKEAERAFSAWSGFTRPCS